MAAVVVLAGAVLAVSGCAATTGGSAAPGTTTAASVATEALWDPCTQISDDVLRQVGVDPSTRDNTISGVADVEGWKLCSWHDKASRWNYTLGVWSTTHSIDEIKADRNNVEFVDVNISGRLGVQFGKVHDTNDEECYIAFPAAGQTIEVSAYKTFTTMSTSDARTPCVIVSDAVGILAPIIPA
ncbi:DUF3558 domain-containing protein [Nocardia rhamnosiphila]